MFSSFFSAVLLPDDSLLWRKLFFPAFRGGFKVLLDQCSFCFSGPSQFQSELLLCLLFSKIAFFTFSPLLSHAIYSLGGTMERFPSGVNARNSLASYEYLAKFLSYGYLWIMYYLFHSFTGCLEPQKTCLTCLKQVH